MNVNDLNIILSVSRKFLHKDKNYSDSSTEKSSHLAVDSSSESICLRKKKESSRVTSNHLNNNPFPSLFCVCVCAFKPYLLHTLLK